MKVKMTLFPLALAAVLGGTPALGDSGELVPVRDVRNLFVPVGFDSRNEIVAVVDGYLPDPCHRLRKPDVRIDPATKRAVIMPLAEVYRGTCPDVIVPFHQVVSLGELKAGDYSVELYDGSKKEALWVAQAKEKITSDDYFYAPVDSASIAQSGGTRKAVLKGRLTNTCMQKDEIRITDHQKTIEVLPILKITSRDPHGRPCMDIERPFEWTVDLPAASGTERHLLHVRSLNGQSVNQVF